MPAPKGIPSPEAGAIRLDMRVGDSRTTWGWMSEDEVLVATHEGKVLIMVEPSELQWDRREVAMTHSMYFLDARRVVRWFRHCAEHLGQDTTQFIQDLEKSP